MVLLTFMKEKEEKLVEMMSKTYTRLSFDSKIINVILKQKILSKS